MDKKQLTNFTRRIVKANNSLSCLGDLTLRLDIDNMHWFDMEHLLSHITAKGISYPYLSEAYTKIRVSELDKLKLEYKTLNNNLEV